MVGYAAFGIRLECDLALPELFQTRDLGDPCWRMETRLGFAPAIECVRIGVDTVYGSVQVRAFASRDVIRLAFDDTGTFDVRGADRVIAWYPGPSANDLAVRADLLGRVMALAAHADGRLALHASAVCVDGRTIAFLGPKHAGKSTLALALVRRGARLLTDDTLVLRFDDRGTVWAAPGVQRVRLWDDAARALGATSQGAAGAKPVVDPLPAEQLQSTETPLDACYVLQVAEPGRHGESVRRDRSSPVHAALACVRFSKLGPLAGGSEGPVVLDRAARLTGTVPVYAAHVCRDLGRLDHAAASFMGWHCARGIPDAVAPR